MLDGTGRSDVAATTATAAADDVSTTRSSARQSWLGRFAGMPGRDGAFVGVFLIY